MTMSCTKPNVYHFFLQTMEVDNKQQACDHVITFIVVLIIFGYFEVNSECHQNYGVTVEMCRRKRRLVSEMEVFLEKTECR